MATKRPQQICVLDLETQQTNFDCPENCELAFVGIKVYTLRGVKPQPQEYRYYLPGQMEKLEQFLRAFDGVIIGHNILAFDYRVLRPLLSLEGIIEKTIDTLAFLYQKNGGRLNGLALDALSQANFGKGKSISGKSVPKLWREGKHQEVIAYNETDCALTMELWWQMVSERTVRIKQPYLGTAGTTTISISPDDLAHLTGQSPRFTFATWKEKIERDGYILVPPTVRRNAQEEYRGEPEPEYEARFNWFYCDHCQKTFLFRSQIQPGFADFEQVSCPQCKKLFGEVRADMGCLLIGQLDGDFGTGTTQGIIPKPFQNMVLRHTQSTRKEWKRWPLLSSSARQTISEAAQRCTICGRSLWSAEINEAQSYENPVDGTPICVECFTTGRWLLTLK